MNTTTKSNSKEFIEIPSNSTMAKDITSYKKNKFTTRDLAETSLLIALVFIATRFINIRLPLASTGGLVHLGNTMPVSYTHLDVYKRQTLNKAFFITE